MRATPGRYGSNDVRTLSTAPKIETGSARDWRAGAGREGATLLFWRA
jgi:hypothetical protein